MKFTLVPAAILISLWYGFFSNSADMTKCLNTGHSFDVCFQELNGH